FLLDQLHRGAKLHQHQTLQTGWHRRLRLSRRQAASDWRCSLEPPFEGCRKRRQLRRVPGRPSKRDAGAGLHLRHDDPGLGVPQQRHSADVLRRQSMKTIPATRLVRRTSSALIVCLMAFHHSPAVATDVPYEGTVLPSMPVAFEPLYLVLPSPEPDGLSACLSYLTRSHQVNM